MKFVKEELDRDILEKDLDRIYCIGNPKVCKEGKSRPIIMKFGRLLCPLNKSPLCKFLDRIQNMSP